MQYLIVFGLIFVVIAFITWRWVVGIDYMQKNHPDYKGEDFLNWSDGDITKSAGRDVWDDEWNAHTEGEF